VKTQSVLIATLVLTNIGLIARDFVRPVPEQAATVAPVLRGHALELVDDRGRVRAEIKVTPAQPSIKSRMEQPDIQRPYYCALLTHRMAPTLN
jgi:hypothetical protein